MEHFQIINTSTTELMINRHLVEVFTKELVNNGMDLSIAEGVSGGSLIDAITIAGSTRVIHVSGIFYSTDAKIKLGVSRETIENYGEYSAQTAKEMALSILNKSGSSLSIATVGQLVIDDANPEKYISIAYVQKGREPWIKTIFLPNQIQHRRLAKAEIVQSVFSHGLHYMRGDKDTFYSDRPCFRFTHPLPQNAESNGVDTLTEKIIGIAKDKKMKIATIESCTAGAIANALTNVVGSSQVFDRGWLAYDENVKARLGVPLLTMANGNVYSLEVAHAMANAVLKSSQADVVIATTGTMETIDTRPFHSDTIPGTIYAAVIVNGKKPFLKKIQIACPLNKTREQLKIEAVAEVLTFTKDLLTSVPEISQQQIPLNVHGSSITKTLQKVI